MNLHGKAGMHEVLILILIFGSMSDKKRYTLVIFHHFNKF